MDSVDKIATVIPKLKNQLSFLKEREKLFDKSTVMREKGKENDALYNNVSNFLSSSTSLSLFRSSSGLLSDLPEEPPALEGQFLNRPTTHLDAMLIPEESINESLNVPFPIEYVVSSLLSPLLKDIEDGAIQKFGPHRNNRQILIDIVCHDLMNKYNLW